MGQLLLILLLGCLRCSAATRNICAIGDSITSGYLSSPPTSPIAIMVSNLNTYTHSSEYAAVDQGVAGTTSADWANTGSGSVLNDAIGVFNSAGGCSAVWYMIGSNDSKTTVAIPWQGYKQNVATTISYLEEKGYTNIVLNSPPYINASSPWSVASSNALLLSYTPTLATIAAGDSARVHVGDTSARGYFRDNTSLLQDGVHPSGAPANAGYTALAGFWASAYERLFLTAKAPPDTAEGFRIRGIGTGEALNGPAGIFDGIAGHGVLNTPDSIAYTFFSFGSVSKMAFNQKYGYLMIDGVDPLFTSYDGAGGEPGQPANFILPLSPLNWGVLPACGGAGQPLCTGAAIWGGVPGNSPTYPHLRDGTYPAWSELRMLCDPNDPQLPVPHCTTANDPFGAEALLQNLQADIHFNRIGGVPDLLPFADGGVASWNVPYGDVTYIRSHYNIYGPDDLNDGDGGWNEWVRTQPSSTRQGGSSTLTGSGAQTYIDFSMEVCSTGTAPGGTPVNGPSSAECGGDAGGFVLPVGDIQTGNLQ